VKLASEMIPSLLKIVLRWPEGLDPYFEPT